MTRFVLFWAALLLAALAVGSTQAVALATMSHDREVWNTARIDALPPELGSRVMRPERACGAPVSAAKLFALHLRASGTRFIALHFNDFRCENRNALCWGSECLYEAYVRSGSRPSPISGAPRDIPPPNSTGFADPRPACADAKVFYA
jgi:hypothetical protein